MRCIGAAGEGSCSRLRGVAGHWPVQTFGSGSGPRRERASLLTSWWWASGGKQAPISTGGNPRTQGASVAASCFGMLAQHACQGLEG